MNSKVVRCRNCGGAGVVSPLRGLHYNDVRVCPECDGLGFLKCKERP